MTVLEPQESLHLKDARSALERSGPERALGHLLAARASGPGVTATASAEFDKIIAALRERSEEALRLGDPADALRRLALTLFSREGAEGMPELADQLIATKNYEAVSVLAPLAAAAGVSINAKAALAYSAVLARLLSQGLDRDQAERQATEENLALIDGLMSDGATLGDASRRLLLRMRVARNATLRRYRAVIADLRVLAKEGDPSPFVTENLFLHLRSKHFPEVAERLDRIVDAVHLTPDQKAHWFLSLSAAKANAQALRLAAQLTRWTPAFGVVAPLRAMVDDVGRAPEVTLGRPPSGRPLIYVNLVSWGDAYVDSMNDVCLASLRAPGNFPALCRDNDVVIEILTDAANVARVAALENVRGLAEICQIKIFALPAEIKLSAGLLTYVVFGYACHFTILRAQRDGADLVFLNSDVLYGDGSFATVAGIVTKERRAFFADGLNAKATPMLQGLAPHRRPGGALEVSCAALSAAASAHLMPRILDNLFFSDARDVSDFPSRIVFRRRFGLSMHSLTKAPVYVSHAAFAEIKEFSYTASDAWFSQDVLDQIRRDELFEVTSAERFLAVELSDSVGATWGRRLGTLEEAIAAIFLISRYTERIFWLFETPVDYPMPDLKVGVEVSEEAQRGCVASIMRMTETDPIFTELLPEQRIYDPVRR